MQGPQLSDFTDVLAGWPSVFENLLCEQIFWVLFSHLEIIGLDETH